MRESTSPPSVLIASVLIVGAGLSGLACARALTDAGIAVRVVDRGRVVGGRFATKRLDDRPVDIGARYFTVPDGSAFEVLVSDWVARGLARPWTDSLGVSSADGERRRTSGPMRFSASAGLRSLAADLADRLRTEGVPVELGVEVTAVSAGGEVAGIRYDTVVLAMPDPQARRMLAPDSPVAATLNDADAWQPAISVTMSWPERHWPSDWHGTFVSGSTVVEFIADDGDRRGDGAPVLVAYSTPAFARQHLEHPAEAVSDVVDDVRSLLGIGEAPTFTHAHRWTFAAPSVQHAEPYGLQGAIAFCGDAWGERSSVSTAWSSGDALGRALAAKLP